MKFKTKFHLTLVILITIANSMFGIPGISHVEKANALDIKNLAVYNKNISNIYNNINIKYISIRLYNINIRYNINKTKVKLSNLLSFKEKVEILMYSIKQVESGGNYKDRSRWSSACGAYQYMKSTWNNYMGYSNACSAPNWVQDARIEAELRNSYKKYGDWRKVVAAHLIPAYANNMKLWNKPVPGNPTVNQYVSSVFKKANIALA